MYFQPNSNDGRGFMKYSIQYDDVENFFCIKTIGEFSIEVFQDLVEELFSHKFWHPGANCLFDYRETDFLKVPIEELQRVSELHIKSNQIVGQGKSAFVMMNSSNYGMGRMYQGMTEFSVQTEFFIFTDFNKAKNWVIVPSTVS